MRNAKGQFVKGYKHPEETKEKIGQNNARYWKGKQRPDISKGQVGRVFSQEHIEKLRLSHLGNHGHWRGKKRPEMTGKNHPNWKGGEDTVRKRKAFSQRRRKATLKASGGFHTLEQWEKLKERFGYMCLCCKRKEPEVSLTEDHIIPVSLGGTDNIDNIQPLCHSCNSRKSAKHIDFISIYEAKETVI